MIKRVVGCIKMTSLIFDAIHDDCPRRLQLLVEYCEADINARDEHDRTPLYVALMRNWPVDAIHMMLRHGADPNSVTSQPFIVFCSSPMIWAFEHERYDLLDLFVQFGGDVNAIVRDGTLLGAAMTTERYSMIEWLIDNGARLNNLMTQTGYGIGHLAVHTNNVYLLKKLLAKNAETKREILCGKDKKGHSAMFHIIRYKVQDVVHGMTGEMIDSLCEEEAANACEAAAHGEISHPA